MDLTTVSKWFRKYIGVFIIFTFGYYLIVHIIIPGGIYAIRRAMTPNLEPNPIYGNLPQLEFIEKQTKSEDVPEIELNTPSGKLPRFLPNSIRVYKYEPNTFSYLAGAKAIEDAAKLGFEDKDLVSDLKGRIYRWRNLDTGGVLTINIDARSLTLNTSLRGKSQLFPAGGISEETAVSTATDLFRNLNRFEDNLYKEGTQKTYLGSYAGIDIIEAVTEREIQLARVDFFRSINEYPILGPDANKGLLHIILKRPSGRSNPLNYPVVEAFYWEINPESKAVYPLIGVETAWDAVKEGNGVISSVIPEDKSPFEDYLPVDIENILIDDIYLAYYDYTKPQAYLQPIYVFEGTYQSVRDEDGEITLYYPAVDGEYVQQGGN